MNIEDSEEDKIDDDNVFNISDDSNSDTENHETPNTRLMLDSKQGMLDTPFLTKGMTDTESDHTTLRGTVKSSQILKDFPGETNLNQGQNEQILFIRAQNPPSFQNSASSRRYSNSLNSSSEYTIKNNNQYPIKNIKMIKGFIKSETIENKENVSSLVNREIKICKAKVEKKKPEGSQRRKISEFYEGNNFLPIRKTIDVNNIIKNMSTPKESDQTTLNAESKIISSIELKSENSQEILAKVYRPRYNSTNGLDNKNIFEHKSDILEYIPEATFLKPSSHNNYDLYDNSSNSIKNNVFDYTRHNFEDTLKIGLDSREITEFKIEDETIEIPSQSIIEDTLNPNISPSPKANEPYYK